MSLHPNQTIDDGQCPPDLKDYVFTSQQQIDDFGKNYPKCQHAPQLKINGKDITNLKGLSNLTSVQSSEEAECQVTDGTAILIGDVASFYSSEAQANPKLINLSGLNNVTHVGGDIVIQNNKSLKDIHAFKALQTMGLNMESNGDEGLTSLNVFANPELQQVDALSQLSAARYVHFNDNPKLSKINGYFNSLTFLSGGLYFEHNGLPDLSAFKYLQSTNDIVVQYGPIVKLGLDNFVGSWDKKKYHFKTNNVVLASDPELIQCQSLAKLYKKDPKIFGVGPNTNSKCLSSLKNG